MSAAYAVAVERVRAAIDRAKLRGEPVTNDGIARETRLALSTVLQARRTIREVDSFARANNLAEAAPMLTDVCVCGHERQDHTRKGRCTEAHARRPGHGCTCAEFARPARGIGVVRRAAIAAAASIGIAVVVLAAGCRPPAILTPQGEDAGPCGYLGTTCPNGGCCVDGMQCSVGGGCEVMPQGPDMVGNRRKPRDAGAETGR